jgi:hypothetical protein
MLKWLGKGIFPGKFGCALEMSMAIVLWHARTSATIGSVACPPSILEAVVSGVMPLPLSWASAGAYITRHCLLSLD